MYNSLLTQQITKLFKIIHAEKLLRNCYYFLIDLNDDVNNITYDPDISMNDISKEEIKEGLRALANNKAALLDFIPAELLKWGDDAMVDELKKIANIVWHSMKAPEKLNAGLL